MRISSTCASSRVRILGAASAAGLDASASLCFFDQYTKPARTARQTAAISSRPDFMPLSPLPPVPDSCPDDNQGQKDHAPPKEHPHLRRAHRDPAILGVFGTDRNQIF